MQSLLRQVRRPQIGGEEMPPIFDQLANEGANARRGEILLLVGQPAAGKSAVALWLAIQWTILHNLKGIYWSADTTSFVAATRTVSQITGMRYRDSEQAIRDKAPTAMRPLRQVSEKGLEWVFDAYIDADSLELNIDAFLEKWGGYPDFLIIDNLTDVDTGREGDEFSALRALMRDLNTLVRKTQAAGVVLHHTSENDKEDPLPSRKSIHGKVSQKPTVILGTSRGERHTKPIGPLKNRYGIDDRSGGLAFDFMFDPDNLQFKGEIGRVLGG